jgi:DNA repair/transcription protein MET18/MMS19
LRFRECFSCQFTLINAFSDLDGTFELVPAVHGSPRAVGHARGGWREACVAMDAMDAAPPAWGQHVDVFTSPDRNTPEADRARALGAIAALLDAGSVTFLDLLRGMESCLVTTDDARRARGVLLLAEAVAGYGARAGGPRASLPAPAAELLAQFFASKLEDFAVIRAALAGCTSLLNARDHENANEPIVTHATATTMADRLFESTHVPSLTQADRRRSYEMLVALVRHPASSSPAGPPLGSCSPAEQIESLVAACDGEKDPRNVLLVCELWKHIPRAFCGVAEDDEKRRPSDAHRAAFAAAAEELYDVVAAYFPVSFRPPPGDTIKVTHEQLASTLRDAMCASPTYAPWAVPHVLESVDPEKHARVVADALASLAACGAAFGRTTMRPHIAAVWSALRGVLLRPPAGEDLDAEGAAKWATRLFAAEWAGGARGAAEGSLAALALADACLGDAAAALAPDPAAGAANAGCCGGGKCGDATEETPLQTHEHREGGGCCGGGEEHDDTGRAKDVSSRGHAIVAAAGRVLGAIGASGPETAAAAMSKGLAPLLDAAGIGEDGNVAGMSAAAKPLALVLATPATCGALDGAARSGSSGSFSVSVLGTVGGRLVRLFAEAATDRERRKKPGKPAGDEEDDVVAAAAIDADDAATLGIAGLRTLLSFPAGSGLTSDAHAREAVLALVAAATAPDEGAGSAERAADLRRRAGDALGAAAAAKDARVASAAESAAMSELISLATTGSTFSKSEAELSKARRALEAMARVVAAAPAARRAALAPLCDAAAARARAAATDGAAAEAFLALADALAGPSGDGDASFSFSATLRNVQKFPAGIFQTAATANDAVSAETSARAASLVASLAAESVVTSFAEAGSRSSLVAGAACRLARAATAACAADAQAPLLAAAEAVALAADREARENENEENEELPSSSAKNNVSLSASDVSFLVAASVFVGARPDAAYPRDADAGTAVTSALARLAARKKRSGGESDVQLAAAHALASLVLKRGGSGALGAAGGLAAATAAGVASPESLAAPDSVGASAAGGVLRALAARGDPAERDLARQLVALLAHEDDRVAAGAARALGEAMSPRGGGAGATRACHGFERPLFRQRFFSQTLPDVLAALAATGASSAPRSVSRRAAYLSAVVHLARHAPASASFQFGERTLPLLPEAAATLAAKGSPFADKNALAAAVVLVASFFADPRGGKALETHADAHAGAMLQALCALAGAAGEENEKDSGILASMEVRETALEALVAATSLPFSAVYPHRRVVAAAATAALDDPKRRVRRAAARCREVWLALDAKS